MCFFVVLVWAYVSTLQGAQVLNLEHGHVDECDVLS